MMISFSRVVCRIFVVVVFVASGGVQVEDALMPIAAATAEAGKRLRQPEMIFFTAKSEADLPKQVRNACGLKTVSESPQVSWRVCRW